MLSAGAAEAIATDREPLALECTLRSAAASGLSSVQPLPDWGCQSDQGQAREPDQAPSEPALGSSAQRSPRGAPAHQVPYLTLFLHTTMLRNLDMHSKSWACTQSWFGGT